MTISLPKSLEAWLLETARAEGRNVDAVVADVLRQFAEQHGMSATSTPQHENGDEFPLRGTVLKYLNPTDPACAESDWKALRSL